METGRELAAAPGPQPVAYPPSLAMPAEILTVTDLRDTSGTALHPSSAQLLHKQHPFVPGARTAVIVHAQDVVAWEEAHAGSESWLQTTWADSAGFFSAWTRA